MIKLAVAKLLTVKAAAAAVLVTAAGGVALAATSGVLPNPLGRPDTAPAGVAASARPGPDATKVHGAPASPSPSLEGLCRAYLANPNGERGKALESPAFRALITAAGDRESVPTYCAGLMVQRSGQPDSGNRPSARPEVPQPSHPGGPPASPGPRN